jgi:hypothetical protein
MNPSASTVSVVSDTGECTLIPSPEATAALL